MQLSLKTRVRQNSIGNTSWRYPGSIFIDFEIDSGGPGIIFESLGASLSKVIFERILGRARGCGNWENGGVTPGFWPQARNILADLLDVLETRTDNCRTGGLLERNYSTGGLLDQDFQMFLRSLVAPPKGGPADILSIYTYLHICIHIYIYHKWML